MPGLVSALRQGRHKPIFQAAPEKIVISDAHSNFFHPQGEVRSWRFSPTLFHWNGDRGYGEWMHGSPNLHLCSQWLPTWYPFLSALRFRQDKNMSLGQHPEKSTHKIYVSVFFFPWREAGNWKFSPSGALLNLQEGCAECVPGVFLLASIQLVS